jgi:hypothetical protein
MKKELLGFGDYYFSDDEEEYTKDLNQRNILIKQTNQLVKEDGKNEANVNRLVNNILFLRNIFCRESILEFVNVKFKSIDLNKMGNIYYELLVNTNAGLISNHRKYADQVFKLMENKGISKNIEVIWETYKNTNI